MAGTTGGRRSGAGAADTFRGFSTSDVNIVFDPAALQLLLESSQGPVGKDLVRRAVRVESAAKRACPVDTGRLRSSIAFRLEQDGEGLYALVGTNVHYARHVEFGTSRTAAKPFLRPALRAALSVGDSAVATGSDATAAFTQGLERRTL